MSNLILGVNPPISNADYHDDSVYLSSSSLKDILKDIKKFHQEKILGLKAPKKSSPALEEGSYAHTVILEPDKIEEEYAFFPGSIKRGVDFNAFKDANPNKTIISEVQRARVQALKEAYERNEQAKRLLTGGRSEETVCSIVSGVPIKVRFDYLNTDKGYIADIKTSGFPVDVDSFRISMRQHMYELSAALYTMVAEEVYQKPFDFYFICLSKEDLNCEVFRMSEETMREGRTLVFKAINKYKRCLETDTWEDEVEESDHEIVSI